MAYQRKQYVIQPLVDLMEDKSANLNKKHKKIIRVIANLLAYPFVKVIRPFLTYSISVTILGFMYHAYIEFDVIYNPVIHFLWAIYFCFVVSQMISTLVFTFSMFSAYSLYLKFRFKQVNLMFKSGKIKIVMRVVVRQDYYCHLLMRQVSSTYIHIFLSYKGLKFLLFSGFSSFLWHFHENFFSRYTLLVTHNAHINFIKIS